VRRLVAQLDAWKGSTPRRVSEKVLHPNRERIVA